MAATTHACPGCTAQVERHRLSCPSCWFRLPPALRERINRTYARRYSEGVARVHREAIIEALTWYREHSTGAR